MSNYPEKDKKTELAHSWKYQWLYQNTSKDVHKTKTLNLNHVKLYY